MSRVILFSLVGMVGMLMTVAATDKTKPAYPPSKVARVTDRLHAIEVVDPYRWLEDSDHPDVKAWTDQQNAFSQAILEKLPGRQKIHQRLSELLEIGSISVARPAKGRYFFTKREGTQNQPILYVRDGLKGKDRVVLDPNLLAADGTTALDWWYPSDDGKLVAYGLSQGGSELSVLHVRDVDAGKDLRDRIERCRACSLAWLPDNSGFYYTRYPSPGSVSKEDEVYYRQVYFHRLGSDPAADPKIFGEMRAKEDWPNLDLSPDGRWLAVTVSQGWSKSEVYLKDLKQDRPFVTVVEGVEALYSVALRNDAVYIRTNEKAPRYRVFRADPSRPARPDWTEILPESEDVLDGVAIVSDRLAALYMHNASSRLRLLDLQGKPVKDVELPTLGTINGLGAEWDGKELFFDFNSFTVPPTVYRVDLRTADTELWERIPSNVDVSAYEVKQVKYPSKDGTPITMFLAYKRGLELNGQNPTLLTGYGGFNISRTPQFSANLILLLEYGGVLALPNLRGGGEYGETWHQAGMLEKKQNVFDDFIAAAEWLIKEKYTNPDKLAIRGGSNGGLLIGAAVTQRPDLFKVAICQVPLLDMLRYHKFRIARLWIPEYGDPEKRKDFQWLRAYSPYHRVKFGVEYPAMLITSAESDTRVDPMHARKMTALLQAASNSDRPILLRLETKAGHGAGKPRAKTLDELTDIWAFTFWQLGVKV